MDSKKKCFKCESVMPLSEFYKHKAMADGFLNKCKKCTKIDVHKHRQKNIERIRAYDRERSKLPDRKKLNIEINRIWRQEDTRRVAAHNAVARAIKKGLLIRIPCEKCGNTKSVAHHEDYDKKLDVIWLCQPCHKLKHKEQYELRTM